MSFQSQHCQKHMFYCGKTYICEKQENCNNSGTHVQKCIKKACKNDRKIDPKTHRTAVSKRYAEKIAKIIIFNENRIHQGTQNWSKIDTNLVQKRLRFLFASSRSNQSRKSHAAVTQESSSKTGKGGSCPLKTINSPTHRRTVGRPEHQGTPLSCRRHGGG